MSRQFDTTEPEITVNVKRCCKICRATLSKEENVRIKTSSIARKTWVEETGTYSKSERNWQTGEVKNTIEKHVVTHYVVELDDEGYVHDTDCGQYCTVCEPIVRHESKWAHDKDAEFDRWQHSINASQNVTVRPKWERTRDDHVFNIKLCCPACGKEHYREENKYIWNIAGLPRRNAEHADFIAYSDEHYYAYKGNKHEDIEVMVDDEGYVRVDDEPCPECVQKYEQIKVKEQRDREERKAAEKKKTIKIALVVLPIVIGIFLLFYYVIYPKIIKGVSSILPPHASTTIETVESFSPLQYSLPTVFRIDKR